MIHTHTLVVRYPEGMWPAYSSDTKINGGELVAVDFDGNRLHVLQEMEEAMEELLFLCDRELADAEDVTEVSRAKAALEKAQSISRGEMEA